MVLGKLPCLLPDLTQLREVETLAKSRPLFFLVSSGHSHTCLPGWLYRSEELGSPQGSTTHLGKEQTYIITKGPRYPK